MKIGIIGAGKVGTTLGMYLRQRKDAMAEIVGFYSKNVETAKETADFVGTDYFEKLEDLVTLSDTLFVTTPDGEIAKVWDCMRQLAAESIIDLNQKLICHFSGSLSSDVFVSIEHFGAIACSIHPIYAFSNKFSAYKQFHKVNFTMEGNEKAVETMKTFFESLGHGVCLLKKEDKAKYHGAMSMASNHMLALLQTAVDTLCQCGFTRKQAYESLETIVTENIKSGFRFGAVEALTGPIERNDVETVEKHLKVLEPQTAVIYKELAKVLISMSKEKNPKRDYETMEKRIGE